MKTDSKGDIIKYKARWVVQGYSQVLGIDYLETFSTTYRPEVYRLILILSVYLNVTARKQAAARNPAAGIRDRKDIT